MPVLLPKFTFILHAISIPQIPSNIEVLYRVRIISSLFHCQRRKVKLQFHFTLYQAVGSFHSFILRSLLFGFYIYQRWIKLFITFDNWSHQILVNNSTTLIFLVFFYKPIKTKWKPIKNCNVLLMHKINQLNYFTKILNEFIRGFLEYDPNCFEKRYRFYQ